MSKKIFIVAVVLMAVMSATPMAAHAQRNRVHDVGGLVNVILQNVAVLNDVTLANILNNTLRNGNVQISLVSVNDSLNRNEVFILNNVLNNSPILSDNVVIIQDVLNNNTLLTNFLNNNNIAIGQVVAIDILSAPVTVFFQRP